MTLSQFLLNLFFAALSAFLGVVMGVWYSKRQFVGLKNAEKKELRRKLIKAFRFNLDRLKQMEGQLTSKQRQEIPDYRLDTESVAHVLFHGRDLFGDESWFDRFNWQRFQLVHINAKVDFLNDLTNLSGIVSDSIFAQGGVGHSRYVSLVGHLRTSQKEISDMIADYEKAG
jgi:hypothetical protein